MTTNPPQIVFNHILAFEVSKEQLAGRPYLLALEGDVLQRAHDLADRLGRDAGIERCGVELGMTEQHLDDTDIGVLLQQMVAKLCRKVCSDRSSCQRTPATLIGGGWIKFAEAGGPGVCFSCARTFHHDEDRRRRDRGTHGG